MTYWIQRDGENYGPYTQDQLQDMHDKGEVALTDLAAEEGGAEWQTVGDILAGETCVSVSAPKIRTYSADPRRPALGKPRARKIVEAAPPSRRKLWTSLALLLLLGGVYFIWFKKAPEVEIAEVKPPEEKPPELIKPIQKQGVKPSQEAINQLGGSDATEDAIGLAIEWLARNQEPEGHWETRKHGGSGDYNTATTGLALLCFYGWGTSHIGDGKYQPTIRKAIDWLVAQQKPDGNLTGTTPTMYSHGIPTIALCEAYAITKDLALKSPAENAIALIIAAQSTNPTRGGWHYSSTPGLTADTSVTGWQYMALHSARLAGLEVPEEVFEKARKWFDFAGGGKHGGLYGYNRPATNTAPTAMIATGMFCRQLDLLPPTDPRMIESAEALKMYPMTQKWEKEKAMGMPFSPPDLYTLYYVTLALYQHQGPIWTDWNLKLKEVLPLLQKKDGPDAGSWDPIGIHVKPGGRVISTAMATLSLEVYYRLLPVYGTRNMDLPPPKQKSEPPKQKSEPPKNP